MIYLDSHPFFVLCCHALFTKIFKSNISIASQALWPWHSVHITHGGSKKKSEGLFRLGKFRVGMWPPEATKRKFIQASKQDNQAKFFWPEKKRGWFFGRWENLLKLDFLNSFQSHVEKQVQVLWMKMRMAWSFFWMLQCNVWILFDYLRGDF